MSRFGSGAKDRFWRILVASADRKSGLGLDRRRELGDAADVARLSIRIDLEGGGRIGPGKVDLLEAVAREGSISAAAAALGMSYRRGWVLIAELSATLGHSVVQTRAGGARGGGATLTSFGRELVEAYRAVESQATEVVAPLLETVEASRTSRGPAPARG